MVQYSTFISYKEHCNSICSNRAENFYVLLDTLQKEYTSLKETKAKASY